MKEIKPTKIQSSIPEYVFDVIEALKGIKGNSTSDIVSAMLSDWVEDHCEYIEKHHKSFKEWKIDKGKEDTNEQR